MENCRQSLISAWAQAGDGRRLVFGEGNADHPGLMLIGEAPGAQEEAQGRPFVGQAGKNLTEFITELGISRGDLWISNTVKVRPSRTGPTGRLSNRPPNRAELAFFTPWLLEEIGLVHPGCLVTLGAVALQAVCGKGAAIGQLHGRLVDAALPAGAFRCFPLYHPAAVIYNRSLTAVYHQDLQRLRQLMADGVI